MSAPEVIEITSDSDGDDLQCLSETRTARTRTAPRINTEPIDLDQEEDDYDDDLLITGERDVLQTERAVQEIGIHVPGGVLPYQGHQRRQGTPPNAASFHRPQGFNLRFADQNGRIMDVDAAAVAAAQAHINNNNNSTSRPHQNLTRASQLEHLRARREMLQRDRRAFLRRDDQMNTARALMQQVFARLNRRTLRNEDLFVDDDYDEDLDDDYIPGMGIQVDELGARRLPMMGWGTFRERAGGDGVEIGQDIMAMLERRDNADFDARSKKNQQATQLLETKIDEAAQQTSSPFTSSIDPDEEYVCVLCGVTLGLGLPEDFSGDKSGSIFAQAQERYDVTAPYQVTKLITDVDRDLSKRIFFAGCGHTYCGRCVKNIANVRELTKAQKLKIKKTDQTIENPYVYAPARCVAENCNTTLRGRKGFQEAFL